MSRSKVALREVPQEPITEPTPSTPGERLKQLWATLPKDGRRAEPRSDVPHLMDFRACCESAAFAFDLSPGWARTLALNLHECSPDGLIHATNWKQVREHVGHVLIRDPLRLMLGGALGIFLLLVVTGAAMAQSAESKAYDRAAQPERWAVRNHFGGRVGTVEALPGGRLAVRNHFGGRVGTIEPAPSGNRPAGKR